MITTQACNFDKNKQFRQVDRSRERLGVDGRPLDAIVLVHPRCRQCPNGHCGVTHSIGTPLPVPACRPALQCPVQTSSGLPAGTAVPQCRPVSAGLSAGTAVPSADQCRPQSWAADAANWLFFVSFFGWSSKGVGEGKLFYRHKAAFLSARRRSSGGGATPSVSWQGCLR